MKAKIICVFSFFFFLSHILSAQEVTGDLEGRILDSAGMAIVDANITISSPSLQGLRGAASGHDGYFRILALPVGSYSVLITHLAYQKVRVDNVLIRLGKTTTLQEIFLQAQLFETADIVVLAPRPPIDLTSTSSGASLAADAYRTLPVERDYRSIAALLPQVTNSFLGDEINFSGSTGLENKYFVDGVETTDPYRGITGTHLPYNLIKEIQVRSGGYEAEYRSSLGGIINVITYSGGNEFKGQAFGFFANNQLSADSRRPALAAPKGDYNAYDFGFSLGGPVWQDKLWFNIAYNPKVQQEDVSLPGLGFFTDKSITHIFAAKLSWQATERTNVVFSMFGDPSSRSAIGETTIPLPPPALFLNPDPYLMDIDRGGISFSMLATHVVNDKILIESSLARISRREKNQPATQRGRNEPLTLDGPSGTWSGGSSSSIDNLSIQTTVAVNATVLFKQHTFKSGIAYRDNGLDNDINITIGGQRAPDLFIIQTSHEKGTFNNRIPSFFIQDSWQLNDRFRLNMGLRWDGQFLIGSDGNMVQKITDQYQPRLGAIYLPGEKGSQKLYASFGRFYQDLALFLSTKHLNDQVFDQAIIFDHDYRIDPSGGDTTSSNPASIQDEVKDLEGQHYDEFTLGYERLISHNLKIGSRGVYRTLRQGIENAFVDPPDRSGTFIYGNPGKGALDGYPEMKREYVALELTLEKFGGETFNFMASYVLSRNYGNYPGLFTSDIVPQPFPNANGAFNLFEATKNSTGLLPNDRTHVFKLSGFYTFDFGLRAGTFFTWQTGKPKNEFGFNQMVITNYLIQKRGAAGRLSSLWDLNLRFSYDLDQLSNSLGHPRLILDIFHLGSQRQPVAREEVHYHAVDDDGNPIAENPTYNSPVLFQPPMTVKFGIEVDF